MLRFLRKIFRFGGVAAFIMLCAALLTNHQVDSDGSKYITPADQAPDADAILVLGASVLANGGVSDILKDRLDTAIYLFQAKRAPVILVSGDHGSSDYNEVGAMKGYLTERKVSAEVIRMDHSGFSTYESVYRSQAVFGMKRVIIVTQEYHLARAVFIARSLGMESWGVAADKRAYVDIEKYRFREFLARNKDFWYARFLKPVPASVAQNPS